MLPCWYVFHVLLVFCRSDEPAAIGRVRHLSPHRGSIWWACGKDQATWILNPAKLSGLAEGRHIEVATNDVNAIHFSDIPDLTQQRSCDSFPLRCRVAQMQ